MLPSASVYYQTSAHLSFFIDRAVRLSCTFGKTGRAAAAARWVAVFDWQEAGARPRHSPGITARKCGRKQGVIPCVHRLRVIQDVNADASKECCYEYEYESSWMLARYQDPALVCTVQKSEDPRPKMTMRGSTPRARTPMPSCATICRIAPVIDLLEMDPLLIRVLTV